MIKDEIEDLDLKYHLGLAATRHLSVFCRYMWPAYEAQTELAWGWYLDAMCEHLEALYRGDFRDLLVNIPPRFLKSTVCGVMFPAWIWLQEASFRFLSASYGLDLAVRDTRKCRAIMTSPRYQWILDHVISERWDFVSDQNEKSRYENNKGGHRIATSTGSATTGEGGDGLIIDDPHEARDVWFPNKRQAQVDFAHQTMATRGNRPKKTWTVIVMQRLHEEDAAARAIERGFTHLCLPMMYEKSHPFIHYERNRVGFKDPRTEHGELLNAKHSDEASTERLIEALGPYGAAGQLQQRPAPAGGAVFKAHQFPAYLQAPVFDSYWHTWDLNLVKRKTDQAVVEEITKASANRSYAAGQTWGMVGSELYLLQEYRGQWSAKESADAIEAAWKMWPPGRVLVENAANGPSAESYLKGRVPGIMLVPTGGEPKTLRAMSVQPFVEAGNFHVPHHTIAPWIGEWLEEVCTFPNAKNDDRVDCLSQLGRVVYLDSAGQALERMRRLVSGRN